MLSVTNLIQPLLLRCYSSAAAPLLVHCCSAAAVLLLLNILWLLGESSKRGPNPGIILYRQTFIHRHQHNSDSVKEV